MDEEKRLYWNQLPCNPLTTQLDPRMLLDNGYFRYQYIALIKRDKKEHCKVFYDRKFVIYKIKQVILKPLGVNSLQELIALLGKFGIQTESETQEKTVHCRIWKLRGENVVRVSELEKQGIKINDVQTICSRPGFNR